MIIKNIYSYELTIEEYTSIKTTIEVIKKLGNTLNSGIAHTPDGEINLDNTLFALSSLLNNENQAIYDNNK